MGDIYTFTTIINMSITASFVILAVLAMRWILRRAGAPKWILCALWAVVFFRLLCPISFHSEYSLLQMLPQSNVIQTQTGTQMQYVEPFTANQLQLQSLTTEPSAMDGTLTEDIAVAPASAVRGTNWRLNLLGSLPLVWIFIALLFCLYHVYSYRCLRSKVATATLVEKNIYETDQISSPFVMDLLKPKIYLPLGLADETRQYILLHEQAHIARRDLWYKAVAFTALMLHWFNPFVHLAYYLLEQDMEQACDEKVLSQLGQEHKTIYSSTLLNMAVGRQRLLLPMAFGESKTKQRIRNILQYHRVPKETLGVFVLLLVMFGMICVSNPVQVGVKTDWPSREGEPLFRAAYFEEQQESLMEIYQILLPDDPFQVKSNMQLSVYGESQWLTIETKKFSQCQSANKEIEQYALTVMSMYHLQNCEISLQYSSGSGGSSSTHNPSKEFVQYVKNLPTYWESKDGLKQLLEELDVEQAAEKADLLWSIRQQIQKQEQQLQAVQEHFGEYDMLTWQTDRLPDFGEKTYRLWVNVYETDNLFAAEKTELDYEKAAILLFAQNQKLDTVEFRFYGSLHENTSYMDAGLSYTRADLERQFGTLYVDENDQPAAQLSALSTLMHKADSLNVPQVTAHPQMPFYEKLRRIDFVAGTPWVPEEHCDQVRFSLLPEQKPLDDGCYLQMNVISKSDEAGNLQVLDSSSELWIYGQKAKWQENYSPVLSQQGDTCELHCSGQYEIVVSCWDMDLRRALEAMGGKAEQHRPSPWTIVYCGRLTFEQQFPWNVF